MSHLYRGRAERRAHAVDGHVTSRHDKNVHRDVRALRKADRTAGGRQAEAGPGRRLAPKPDRAGVTQKVARCQRAVPGNQLRPTAARSH